MAAPLSGIKVLEVANWLAAPSSAALMADLGADVVKVEPPSGDSFRGSAFAAEMLIEAPFQLDNRGKRSVTVALDQPAGRKVVWRLAKDADIFVTNLTAPRLERYGLTVDEVRATNPRVIYVVLTGYGTSGPDADRLAYDFAAFWARSGIMNLIGDPDGPPQLCRGGQGDHATALNLLASTLAALRLRDQTGEGQLVEVTLQRSGLWTIGMDVANVLLTGEQPQRHDTTTPRNPLFNRYQTADGRWVMWAMGLAPYWAKACAALGRPEWEEDPRYSTVEARAENTGELTPQIVELIASQPLAYWTQPFTEHGLIWATVAELTEAIADPSLREFGAFATLEHPEHGPFETLNTPFTIAGAEIGPRASAPEPGEHTHEVLLEAGFGEEELAQLAADGVFG